MRRVILTLSGKVSVSSGSEIWSRIARVMKAAGANIETAGGTFVRMPQGGEEDSLENMSFSVSAFGAHISPAVLEADVKDLGCAMYLKAILPQSRVTSMMQLLRTESPLQVYTVSCSGTLPARLALSHCFQEDARTGTVHLFGVDRPGQLARITQTLSRCGATVMQLHVQSSVSSAAERYPLGVAGLAENSMRIVVDDSFDAALLRREIARVGAEVGYAVTCVTMDSQARLRSTLPSYVLRKKAFAIAYLGTVTGRRSRGPRRVPGVGLASSAASRRSRSCANRAAEESRRRRRRRCRVQQRASKVATSCARNGRRSGGMRLQCWHI